MSSYQTSQRSGSSISSQSAGPDSNLGQTLTTLTEDFRFFSIHQYKHQERTSNLATQTLFYAVYTVHHVSRHGLLTKL